MQQALALVGIRKTQLYLTTSGLKAAMKSSTSKLIHFESFWNTNLERALLAREVARLMKADEELAYTAAMLQDFLLPLITNQLFDKYLDFTENREEFKDLIAFERQRLGWDHAEAGAQVMRGWNLPDELICCVCLHHKGMSMLQDARLGESSVAAVAVSSKLPDAIRQIPDGIGELVKLEEAWPEFDLLAVAKRVDEAFRDMATNATNHFSFLRLCEKTLQRSANDPK